MGPHKGAVARSGVHLRRHGGHPPWLLQWWPWTGLATKVDDPLIELFLPSEQLTRRVTICKEWPQAWLCYFSSGHCQPVICDLKCSLITIKVSGPESWCLLWPQRRGNVEWGGGGKKERSGEKEISFHVLCGRSPMRNVTHENKARRLSYQKLPTTAKPHRAKDWLRQMHPYEDSVLLQQMKYNSWLKFLRSSEAHYKLPPLWPQTLAPGPILPLMLPLTPVCQPKPTSLPSGLQVEMADSPATVLTWKPAPTSSLSANPLFPIMMHLCPADASLTPA